MHTTPSPLPSAAQAILADTVNHPRAVAAIVHTQAQRHGDGLRTRDLVGSMLNVDIAPFIVVSFYEMSGPTFPPHPHAGFSVATYIVPESTIGFVNQDSLGHRNRIPPGALHWTTAGAGVIHEEQPEHSGGFAHGYQIWIDLADDERERAPDARHLAADRVPVARAEGSEIRAVLGASNGLVSPLATPTPVRLIDVALAPGARFAQALDTDENAFGCVRAGMLRTPGGEARAGDVVVTAREGDGLVWTAGAEGARVLLFSGAPQSQRRVQRGPFVARDERQLAGFASAFQRGAFGHVTPFAQAPFGEGE